MTRLAADLRRVIEGVALELSLDPLVLEAIALVESGGEPTAWNPEPRYRWFWDVAQRRPFRAVTEAEVAAKRPPADFAAIAGDPDQEWWGQQASWGLLQVMGAVAREHGCRLPFLPALVDPRQGVLYGAKTFRVCLAWAGGDIEAAAAAYNGGRTRDNEPGVAPKRNQAYATKVLSQVARLRSGG